jgi:hypothetical protein
LHTAVPAQTAIKSRGRRSLHESTAAKTRKNK